MRRFSYKKYLVLGLTLFALITLPSFLVEGVRHHLITLFSTLKFFKANSIVDAEKERLENENHLLKNEILKLRGLLQESGQKIPGIKTGCVGAVIYRDPASWSSTLWIDLGQELVKKGSPVLSGKSLVGVIDYVGKHHSRVRLLTDSALQPSVRVFRKNEGLYLAKGVLKGTGEPLWRSLDNRLRGIGFNYDFPDKKGPAREIATSDVPLILVGDLLVTTGMDGVFPADLKVAIVTKVEPIKEGGYCYEIEAKPTCEHLNELKRVMVIPPLEFEGETE